MDESAGQRSDSHNNNVENARQGETRARGGRSRRRGRGKRSGGEQKRRQPEQQHPQQATPQRPSGEGGRGGRRRGGGRRRPQPQPETMPDHVLRRDAVRQAPVQPMRLRPIVEDDTSEPEFGCPMLTRTRLGLPFRGGQQVPRCSMGWAVHDEDEVLFCMHTPTRNACWKEHPENLEKLVERLRPVIEAELQEREGGSVAD